MKDEGGVRCGTRERSPGPDGEEYQMPCFQDQT